MNRILLTAVAVLLVSSGLAVASDRHHHHFGGHYHRSHGYHYGLHSYSHRSHYGHSGISFGLSLLSRHYAYGSSYQRSYGYSYPSRYRYYSTPSYYSSRSYYVTPSYRYSYPTCQVQSVIVQPRSGVIVPQAPAPKKKIEPTPQAVPIAPPPPPAPNAVAPTARGVSVASHRRTQSPVVTNVRSNPYEATSELSALLGPQLSATAGRSLFADESVPFVVPVDEPAPIAATGPLFAPVTTSADRAATGSSQAVDSADNAGDCAVAGRRSEVGVGPADVHCHRRPAGV